MTAAVRSLVVKVGLRGVAPYTAGMSTMGAATGKFAGQARLAGPAAAGAGRGLARLGTQAGLLSPQFLGPAGIVIGLTKAVGAAVAFQDEQIKLRTQIGLSAQASDELADSARNVGTQYGIGGQEAIEASFFIASAGLRGKDATDALERSAAAAALGLGETKDIADLVTSAMNAYGPSVLTAGRATDILLAGVREGKFAAEDLAGALGRVLPTASALNISFEDITGTIALWSRTGSPVTESTTSLMAIMSTLLGTSEQGVAALEEVGLSLEQLREMAAQPGGLIEVMRTLDEAFDGNLETMREVVPNVRAFRGVMATLAQDAGVVDSVMGGVADSVGLVDDGIAILEETSTRFKWDKFTAGIGAWVRAVGEDFIPIVNAAIDTLSDFFSASRGPAPGERPEGPQDFMASTSAQGVGGGLRDISGLNIAQSLDQFGVMLGILNDLETDAGRRYLNWLGEAAIAGDRLADKTLRDLQREYRGTGDAVEVLVDDQVSLVDTTNMTNREIAKFQEHGRTYRAGAQQVVAGVDDMDDAMADLSAHVRRQETDWDKLAESMVEFAAEAFGANVAMQRALAEQEEAAQAAADAHNEATEGATKSWEDFADDFPITIASVTGHLNDVNAEFGEWADNLGLVAQRAGGGVAARLAMMGPEWAPIVAEAVTATAAELAALDQAMADNISLQLAAAELAVQMQVMEEVVRQGASATVDSVVAATGAGVEKVAAVFALMPEATFKVDADIDPALVEMAAAEGRAQELSTLVAVLTADANNEPATRKLLETFGLAHEFDDEMVQATLDGDIEPFLRAWFESIGKLEEYEAIIAEAELTADNEPAKRKVTDAQLVGDRWDRSKFEADIAAAKRQRTFDNVERALRNLARDRTATIHVRSTGGDAVFGPTGKRMPGRVHTGGEIMPGRRIRRFHDGGELLADPFGPLASDDVPLIGQVGEIMLNRRQSQGLRDLVGPLSQMASAIPAPASAGRTSGGDGASAGGLTVIAHGNPAHDTLRAAIFEGELAIMRRGGRGR